MKARRLASPVNESVSAIRCSSSSLASRAASTCSRLVMSARRAAVALSTLARARLRDEERIPNQDCEKHREQHSGAAGRRTQ